MKIVEFMQDNSTPIATGVGAVAIVCFLLAKYYDKIEFIERNGTKMIFSKNQKSVDKNVLQNVGNFEVINKKKVKNHKEKYGDNIKFTNAADVKDAGNVKIVNEEEIEDGEKDLSRTIEFGKVESK